MVPKLNGTLKDLIISNNEQQIINYFSHKIDEFDLLIGAVECYKLKISAYNSLILAASNETKVIINCLLNNEISENVPILYLAHLLKSQQYTHCYDYLNTINTSSSIECYIKSECCFALSKFSELQDLLKLDQTINTLLFNGIYEFMSTNTISTIHKYIKSASKSHLSHNMPIIQNLLFCHEIDLKNPLFDILKHDYITCQLSNTPTLSQLLIKSQNASISKLIQIAFATPTFTNIQIACDAIINQIDTTNLISIYQNPFLFFLFHLVQLLLSQIYPAPIHHIKYAIPHELQYLHDLLNKFRLYASVKTVLFDVSFVMGLNLDCKDHSDYSSCLYTAMYALHHSQSEFINFKSKLTLQHPLFPLYLNVGLKHHNLPLVPMVLPQHPRHILLYHYCLNQLQTHPKPPQILFQVFISFHLNLPLPTHPIISELLNDIPTLLVHYQKQPSLQIAKLLQTHYLLKNDYSQAHETWIILNQFDHSYAPYLYGYYIRMSQYQQAFELFDYMMKHELLDLKTKMTHVMVHFSMNKVHPVILNVNDITTDQFDEIFAILRQFEDARMNLQFTRMLVNICEQCVLGNEQKASITWLIAVCYELLHLDALFYIKQSVGFHKNGENCALYIHLNVYSNPVQCQSYLQFLNEDNKGYYKALLYMQQHMYVEGIKLLMTKNDIRSNELLYQILYRQDLMHLIQFDTINTPYLQALFLFYKGQHKESMAILLDVNTLRSKLLMLKMVDDPVMIIHLLKQLPMSDQTNYLYGSLNKSNEQVAINYYEKINENSLYFIVGMASTYKDIVKQRQLLKHLLTVECTFDNFEILQEGLLRLAEIYMNKEDNAAMILNKLIKNNINCTRAYELLGDMNKDVDMYYKAYKMKDYEIGLKLAQNLLKNKEFWGCLKVCDEMITMYTNSEKVEEVMTKALNNMYK